MKRLLSIFAIALLFMIPACQKKPVATVNGDPITEKELDQYMSDALLDHQGTEVDKEAIRRSSIEQLISEKLLLQGSAESGIVVTDADVDAELQKTIDAMGKEAFDADLAKRGMTLTDFKNRKKTEITINKFIASLVPDDSITDEDVKKFYQESSTPMLKPARVNVRFIEAQSREEAESILKDMKDKKTGFDKMADSLENKQGVMVSQYGWTEPEFFSPEITAALKTMKKGTYGGPYQGKKAWYIISVKDREESMPMTFDEAKDGIRQRMLNDNKRSSLAHWVLQKRKVSDVVIN